MPANTPSINFIGQTDLSDTPQGRIITWALTYGRYIMIGTEIVVLLAFISRFSLDRKLTDLKEEIDQKQAILTANLPLENEIRTIQDQVIKIKTLIADQSGPTDAMNIISSLLPADVYVTSMDVTKDRIVAYIVAGTIDGFDQFLASLQSSKEISNINIGDIQQNPLTGYTFKVSITVSQKKPAK